MSAIDDDWLDQRIERTKTLIINYEAAIDALAGGAQMYQLDTGQTRQLVQKANLASLRGTLDELENRLSTLEARKCGAGSHGRPTF